MPRIPNNVGARLCLLEMKVKQIENHLAHIFRELANGREKERQQKYYMERLRRRHCGQNHTAQKLLAYVRLSPRDIIKLKNLADYASYIIQTGKLRHGKRLMYLSPADYTKLKLFLRTDRRYK